MTEQPERPDSPGFPAPPPPAGVPPYPYSYPPGPPAGSGPYTGAYPPPPMPYGDYYSGGPMAPAMRNGMGVGALVVAIIALFASCSVAGGIVLGIVAVILGFVGRGRVKRGEANNGSVATTGMVLGLLAIAVSVAFMVYFVGFFNKYGGQELRSCIQSSQNDNDKIQQCIDEFQQRIKDQTEGVIGQTRTPGR